MTSFTHLLADWLSAEMLGGTNPRVFHHWSPCHSMISRERQAPLFKHFSRLLASNVLLCYWPEQVQWPKSDSQWVWGVLKPLNGFSQMGTITIPANYDLLSHPSDLYLSCYKTHLPQPKAPVPYPTMASGSRSRILSSTSCLHASPWMQPILIQRPKI